MEDHELEVFRRQLKDLRKKLGLSQELFAIGVGMDQSYLSKLERGVNRLTAETYERINDFINSEELKSGAWRNFLEHDES